VWFGISAGDGLTEHRFLHPKSFPPVFFKPTTLAIEGRTALHHSNMAITHRFTLPFECLEMHMRVDDDTRRVVDGWMLPFHVKVFFHSSPGWPAYYLTVRSNCPAEYVNNCL
jgi:hypothetical protein